MNYVDMLANINTFLFYINHYEEIKKLGGELSISINGTNLPTEFLMQFLKYL